MCASAEVHTLPPRKRLGCVMRDVAHSPTDLGSKKARIAGEAYVRAALRDPRLLGKALEIASEELSASRYDAEGSEDAGAGGNGKSKKGRNASSSSLTQLTTEKKKKTLTTKKERSTTPALKSDDDDENEATENSAPPLESGPLTDEQMAMRLHLEMNASPRQSRGSSRSSQMLAGRALFG